MQATVAEVSSKGRVTTVPAVVLQNRRIICEGKWLRTAHLHDEEWLEGQPIDEPSKLVASLRDGALKADVFRFSQALPETSRKHPYYTEWESLAVAPTSDFKGWWEGLPQESRKNVRRSERRGVTVRVAEFDEALVAGIKGIYDETPLRQGRRFWHYGKDLETIKRENSSYLERSQFIGAFWQDELIGFIKLVYVGPAARIMQILSKNSHFDKRPANALLAKAVEACSLKPVSHLIYGQYVYGNKSNSPVTEFKRRTGFQEVLLPRYYVPLTLKGRMAVATKLHRGAARLLPEWLVSYLLRARLSFYERALRRSTPGLPTGAEQASPDTN